MEPFPIQVFAMYVDSVLGYQQRQISQAASKISDLIHNICLKMILIFPIGIWTDISAIFPLWESIKVRRICF